MRALNFVILFLCIAFAIEFTWGPDLAHSPITVFKEVLSDPWAEQNTWDSLITLIWGASLIGVFAGVALNREIYIYSSFAAAMATWVGAFYDLRNIAVTTNLFSGNTFILDFLLVSMIIGYMFMLIEFVRGRDG